jgi:hypothetical protein
MISIGCCGRSVSAGLRCANDAANIRFHAGSRSTALPFSSAADGGGHRRNRASRQSCEKAGGFSFVNASLHQPRRCGVPQPVRRYEAMQACEPHSALERGLDRFDRLTVPLDGVLPNDALGLPSP